MFNFKIQSNSLLKLTYVRYGQQIDFEGFP